MEILQATTMDNKSVLAHWNSAPEFNNNFFTIERSRDGQKFETIGEVKGAGNSSATINYSFVDETPYSGVSYYRLKQTDYENKTTFSPMVSVKMDKLQFKVFPNPISASEALSIDFKDFLNQEITIQIFDLSGKRVIKKNILANENQFGIQLGLSGLAPGLYTLTFSSSNLFEKQSLTVN